MNIKPVMITAPILAAMYDRIFLAPSWKHLLRRRWVFYLALAATGLVNLKHTHRMEVQGMGIPRMQMTPWDYLASQMGVVSHYLRLASRPDGLILDYAWPVARTAGRIVPYAALISALLGVTLWALWRRPAWGFLGAWFFGILAPTSTIITIDYLAFEHRMYLSLAAVGALVLVSVYLLGRRLLRRFVAAASRRRRLGWVAGVALLALACGALGARTMVRSADHAARERIWASIIRERPWQWRAHYNLGVSLAEKRQDGRAIECYRRALRIWQEYADAHANLAAAPYRREKIDEAIGYYRRAIQIDPARPDWRYALGKALAARGDDREATEQFKEAVRLEPDHPGAHFQLAMASAREADLAQVATHYRQALRSRPDWPAALNNLAWILAHGNESDGGDPQEAISLARRACRLTGNRRPRMLITLAAAYRASGRIDGSREAYRRAALAARQQGDMGLARRIEAQAEQMGSLPQQHTGRP